MSLPAKNLFVPVVGIAYIHESTREVRKSRNPNGSDLKIHPMYQRLKSLRVEKSRSTTLKGLDRCR
jgi:hypothetical protein